MSNPATTVTDANNTLTADWNDPSKCVACQVSDHMDANEAAGRPLSDGVSDRDSNAWSMWGCCCDEESAEDAQSYMDAVTR